MESSSCPFSSSCEMPDTKISVQDRKTSSEFPGGSKKKQSSRQQLFIPVDTQLKTSRLRIPAKRVGRQLRHEKLHRKQGGMWARLV